MKLLDILLSPIRNNPRFYLALMFLFTISIIPIEYGRCSRIRAGLEMFGDIYLLCALITPLPAKFRRWVKYAFFGLFYIVGLVDMMCYQTMGVALIPNVLQTWLQTNMQEASEALSHELYGHGSLYNQYRDRRVSGHEYRNTSRDHNILLRNNIKRARMETVSYFK